MSKSSNRTTGADANEVAVKPFFTKHSMCLKESILFLQLHFSFNGPFGDAMAEQLKPLAESINQEPGFLWKVWTESEKNHEAGGIYLFTDEKSALAYLEKHTARLKNLGVEEVVAKVFDVNEPLSQINQAKLA